MKFFSLSSYRAIRYSLTTSKFISLQSVRHLEPHSIDGLPFKPVNYSSQSCRKLTIIRYNGGDGATGGTAEGGGPGRSSEGVLSSVPNNRIESRLSDYVIGLPII